MSAQPSAKLRQTQSSTPIHSRIFRSVGDTPLRFLRWHGARTAELEFPPQGGEAAYHLRLTCGGETCTLDRTPVEGGR